MFAPYCPRHHSRVLLFAENIESLNRSESGFEVHFRCTCGYRGTWIPDRQTS